MTGIAIVGAGAIGATVGAWLLADPDASVIFCTRTPFDHLRLQTPDTTHDFSADVLTDPARAVPVDWVLVATKTYDALATSLWLDRLVVPSTRIAVLQNGVEHLSRFRDLAPGQIVPVIVDIPAERVAPGNVRQRRNGSMLVPAGENGEAFARLFTHSPIKVLTTEDWLTAAWRKLAINCAGAVNALTLKPAGIAHDPDIAALMRAMVGECVAVGIAEGAALDDALPQQVVDHYRASPADSINSLHADRLAGRQTEADARNGVIARLGARHGIEAPLNKMAATILTAS